MVTQAEKLAEAYKRGILPPEMASKYEEAQARGLLSSKPAEKQIKEEKPSISRTIFDQAMQGATFGWADEVTEPLGVAIAGLMKDPISTLKGEVNDPDLAEEIVNVRQTNQKQLKQQFDQYPGTSIAANIAGGLLTGAAGATTKAGAAANNLLRGGNLLSRTAKAGVAGAASGALYGAGSSQGDRLEDAGYGAATGALFGAAIPLAGATARGVKKAVGAGKDIISPPPDMALKKVAQRLADDGITLEGAKSRLQKAPQGTALIDVGRGNIERLGEAVANVPGSGANTAGRFVAKRLSGEGSRIKQNIGKYVARGDLTQIADDLMKAGDDVAAPLYDKAFRANKSVDTPAINRILRTPAGSKALSEAKNKMLNDMTLLGVPDKELAEQAKLVDAYVSGGISKGLKLRTLDYVKRSLDDQIGRAIKAGERDESRILSSLKNSLINELDNADITGGAYKAARKAWSGAMQGQNALESGRNFLKLDASEIRKNLQKMGNTERELFKVGVAQHMRDMIDSAGDRSNMVKRIFGKQEYRDALKTVLGDKDFKSLRASLMREEKMHFLNNRLLGNSRTLLRQQEVADLMKDPSDILMAAGSGGKSVVFSKIRDSIVRKYEGINRETASKIAKMLFETDPQEQQKILLQLQNQAIKGDKPALKGYLLYLNIGNSAQQINAK